MHQFQSYPIDLLELNPFTKLSDEWMIITSGNQDKVNGMTADHTIIRRPHCQA